MSILAYTGLSKAIFNKTITPVEIDSSWDSKKFREQVVKSLSIGDESIGQSDQDHFREVS